MERTVKALAGVLDFAREMSDEVDRVDAALPPLRRLLERAGVAFRLVGGVAVVHHGYVRTTRDVDVPETLAGSPSDPAVVGLPGLLQLKLYSARHQDLADVVALLKRLDDGEYLRVEVALPAALRTQLAELRRDALEERSWESPT